MTKSDDKTNEPVVQGPSAKPQSSGGKVVIGSRLPHGLRMRVYRMVPQREATMGGYRDVVIAEQIGEDVLLNRSRVPFGMIPRHKVVNGYAITEGVDEDFWKLWLKDNAKSPMVRNQQIFAENSVEKAVARAKELVDELSGLEPFRRDGTDPRRPKKTNAHLDDVTEVTRDDVEASA